MSQMQAKNEVSRIRWNARKKEKKLRLLWPKLQGQRQHREKT